MTFFNPTFGFVHIWPKFGLKQPSFGFECRLCVLHSKKCWVVWTQIWVKYGQTQMLG